jgi:hypothetical protein
MLGDDEQIVYADHDEVGLKQLKRKKITHTFLNH